MTLLIAMNSATVRRVGASTAQAQTLGRAYFIRGEFLSLSQDFSPLVNAAGARVGINPGWIRDPLSLHLNGSMRWTFGYP